mmetsp:Transcript_18837/g.51879  ORF Transcript_18837/g.51879 Transcript_18837/m.51879 type:complete len:101 (+) Transcript_18837:800-1102(+)
MTPANFVMFRPVPNAVRVRDSQNKWLRLPEETGSIVATAVLGTVVLHSHTLIKELAHNVKQKTKRRCGFASMGLLTGPRFARITVPFLTVNGTTLRTFMP